MPLDWMDVSQLSFNSILLLEQVQLSWLPGWSLPKQELSLALKANPVVEWFMRHKCPQLNEWLDGVISAQGDKPGDPAEIHQAEVRVLSSLTDLLVYAVDPTIYDDQPFLGWDTNELMSLIDFTGKVVIDVGAGTGRLTLPVAEKACVVFAVEPVGNLRTYLKKKAQAKGLQNIYPLDGLITDIPLPGQTADITMGGHIFGDDLDAEYNELLRVTKTSGMIVLCPGNNDTDNDVHRFLVAQGFKWSRFEEPRDGWKRKYWR